MCIFMDFINFFKNQNRMLAYMQKVKQFFQSIKIKVLELCPRITEYVSHKDFLFDEKTLFNEKNPLKIFC